MVALLKRELVEYNMKLQVHTNCKLDEVKKSKTRLKRTQNVLEAMCPLIHIYI